MTNMEQQLQAYAKMLNSISENGMSFATVKQYVTEASLELPKAQESILLDAVLRKSTTQVVDFLDWLDHSF